MAHTYSALEPIRQTILTRLRSDEVLMAKVTGVFDEAPEGQPLPYIAFGGVRSSSIRTLSRLREEVTVTLVIWSDTTGFGEANGILDDLNRLLADQELTGADNGKIPCRYMESEAGTNPDHPNRKGTVSYRLLY
ncbi:DUF3168 domain-containing protein [Desmospora profundinema]|uniref:DUF3168 domain-containing protein n=1 Tax=Desmospora profundinema TaxID=1571184 RepID=A0ABU1IKZ2_9BACL|nr:DUF3168 domain-containing protein [Desmospora profundinema]MDR6225447.1 hypothetical protein [Desmospora profundinema]